jgi:DNA-binding NtrC family response regulator
MIFVLSGFHMVNLVILGLRIIIFHETRGGGKMHKILVVDDDENILIELQDMLEMEGYDVDVALNVPDALSIIEKDINYSLCIIDIEMPGLRGCDLYREVVKNYGVDKLKFIVVSGNADIAENTYEDMSGLIWLKKPVDPDLFCEIIAKEISR